MPKRGPTWRDSAIDTAVGLAILSAFWLIGEAIARLLPGSPLPGSLWGMVALFVVLSAGGLPERRVQRAASLLVRWLGLLFVPVGVGVVAYGALIRTQALAIVVAIVVGSLLTIVASAFAASRFGRGRSEVSDR